MKNIDWPKVSIVICTYNCKNYLERCLKSIKKQDYPKKKLEIIIVDSYSNDGTIDVAKKYNCELILTKVKGYMEGKGMPKSMGCEKAKGKIIITIDSDNAMVEKDWIKKMVLPLETDNSINFCISKMLLTDKDPLINQYLSLIGTDPFAVYCSIDSQLSLENLNLIENQDYFKYTLTKNNFFIVGGYYFAIKKKTLDEIGGYTRDVDNAFLLAKNNKGTFAVPKKAHLHHLITTDAVTFFKKKIKWGNYFFANPQLERHFKWSKGVFGRFSKTRFYYEVLRNFLFFPALIVSLKMFIKTGKKAWILHAPTKFTTTLAYLIAFLKSKNKFTVSKDI